MEEVDPLGTSCQRESSQSHHFLLSGCARACASMLTIGGGRDDSDGNENIRSAPLSNHLISPSCQMGQRWVPETENKRN